MGNAANGLLGRPDCPLSGGLPISSPTTESEDAFLGVAAVIVFVVEGARSHVLLCWLALLLIRVAERSTDLTWRRIAIELGRVHAVTLTGSAGSVVHVTPLNTTQTGILAACKVTPPPTVTTLTPA